jgi:BirA family transcriptional regulator, biotin operon repressor / biotin---[acetyl-CoA-carboxylase] ligase
MTADGRPVRSEAPPEDLVRAMGLLRERRCRLGQPMHFLARVDSTNDEAKRGAKDGASHGTTWVADYQSAGRGRQGRRWFGQPGESLLFSTLARVSCPPSRLPYVGLVAGLAVRDAVARAVPGVAAKVKWPNDVVVDDRKVAGILVEAVTTGHDVEAVVVGMGINVHSLDFPDEIEETATSVALLSPGIRPDRGVLLADVLEVMGRDLDAVLSRGLGVVRARLQAADALLGRAVAHDAGERGTAAGPDEDGRLLVRRDDGVMMRWSAGEVHLVGDATGRVK